MSTNSTEAFRASIALTRVAKRLVERTYHCDHTIRRDVELLRKWRVALMRSLRRYTFHEDSEAVWFQVYLNTRSARDVTGVCRHDTDEELDYIDAMVRFCLRRMNSLAPI